MRIIHPLLMIVFLLVTGQSINAQMRVHQINVGQGCATLIEFPCAAILVDAGGESNSDYNSSEALKTYLADFFDRRNDLNNTLHCVYLSHPHKDHTLGIPVLLSSPYIIKNAVTDGLEKGSGKPGQVQLHRAVQRAEENADPTDDIGFDAITTDEIADTGFTNNVIDPVNCQGVNPVIKILWGASAINPGWSNTDFSNGNNHSLVLKIQYGASSLLIIGDLEEAGQRSLVSKYSGTNLLDADVYLVGHHGSKNGTSQELLNKITPKIALIGVGDPGREISWTAWAYGHPNKIILDKLKNKVSLTRPSIEILAGTSAKTFVTYTISKAIYATAWDDNIVLEADAVGNWRKVDTAFVPVLININNANLSELETLPGIGATKAQAIIDYRTLHGNFASIDQLDNVPGIGPATINLVRAYIKL